MIKVRFLSDKDQRYVLLHFGDLLSLMDASGLHPEDFYVPFRFEDSSRRTGTVPLYAVDEEGRATPKRVELPYAIEEAEEY